MSTTDGTRNGAAAERELVDLDRVNLSDQEFWLQPAAVRHAVFDALRRERPFAFFPEPVIPFIEPGPGYTAVTRHADVEAISCRPAVFSSARGATTIPDLPPQFNEFFGSMINLDDPRHAKIRRIVAKSFTPRMLEQLVDDVRRIAVEVADAARSTAEAGDGTIDVVADLAAPIPLRVICDLMGVPAEDRALVLQKSNVILSSGDPELVATMDDFVGALLEAGGALAELMNRMSAQRLADPRDDLTTALVSTEVDGERLSSAEIASFFILLLVAGNETTRNAISHGVLALAEHPEQRDRWAADPSLTPTAVEELVRWGSPIGWMRRTAVCDGEVNGHRFRAGDKFVLFYGAAIRDPAVFRNPHQLDLARDPNPQLGFGAHGPHFCLGAHLARREVAVTFRTLFDRLPDLQLAGEPVRLRSSFVHGIKHLPARLSGAR